MFPQRRKANEVSPPTALGFCLEALQDCGPEKGSQAKHSSLAELRNQASAEGGAVQRKSTRNPHESLLESLSAY